MNSKILDFLKLFSGTILVFFVLALSGCSLFKKNVAPFEREVLAKHSMKVLSYPTEEIGKQHMFNAREGSSGGFGGGGGGCGCN